MGGLVVLLRVAMPPKKRPGELLCFFGTKDPGRRTALSKCHAKGDFGGRRRWMSLDEIVEQARIASPMAWRRATCRA